MITVLIAAGRLTRQTGTVLECKVCKLHACKGLPGNIMTNPQMARQIAEKNGFIAALDQSGGSTPKALRLYGVNEDAYSNDEEMFGEIQKMRARIITALLCVPLILYAVAELPPRAHIALSLFMMAIGLIVARRFPEHRLLVVPISLAASTRYIWWRGTHTLDRRVDTIHSGSSSAISSARDT